jgi:hypothetical protein
MFGDREKFECSNNYGAFWAKKVVGYTTTENLEAPPPPNFLCQSSVVHKEFRTQLVSSKQL